MLTLKPSTGKARSPWTPQKTSVPGPSELNKTASSNISINPPRLKPPERRANVLTYIAGYGSMCMPRHTIKRAVMGEKEIKRLTLRVEPELHRKWKALAAERGKTMVEVLRACIEAGYQETRMKKK